MDVTVENFTSTLRQVDQRIQIMRQFSLCAKLEYSPGPGCHALHSCSGLLCQELLQGPKRREGGRKWVQNADLINANEQFVAVLNSGGVYFLNSPLCSNRYSNSQCQCVLGKHSVLYMW